MVELSEGTYDYDGIPFASASLVSIDAEISDDTIVTAEAIPSSPGSSLTGSAHYPSRSETPVPEEQSFGSMSWYSGDNVSSHGDWQNEMSPDEVRVGQRTVGAGAAGAVLGLLVGGPVLSLVIGFGTAYYTKQEGATGDLARALGAVALEARDKWREVNSKHHLVVRSRQAANEAIHQIQKADRKHHGRKHFFKFVASCWKKTHKLVERHRLVERGCDKLKILTDHMAKRMQHQHRVRGCPCHSHSHGHHVHHHNPCTFPDHRH